MDAVIGSLAVNKGSGPEMGSTGLAVEVGRHRLACGLTRYGAASMGKINGRRSEEIVIVLGHENSPEVVHRDDLVVLCSPGFPLNP